jgi:hypothetical protein
MVDRKKGDDPVVYSSTMRGGSASFSPDKKYRYLLARRWDHAPVLPFVMLNPSSANEDEDDPTVRRCIGFAKREGAGGIMVANLMAFVATDPADLVKAKDAPGPMNIKFLTEVGEYARDYRMPVVCAWGAHAEADGYDTGAVAILKKAGANLVCFGVTKGGYPKHPLYLAANTPIVPYRLQIEPKVERE